jgi:transposase-like protein
MNQDKIRAKYEKLENRRLKILAAIQKLQETCEHPEKEKIGSGRDGDGDFWVNFKCPNCQKTFSKIERGFR